MSSNGDSSPHYIALDNHKEYAMVSAGGRINHPCLSLGSKSLHCIYLLARYAVTIRFIIRCLWKIMGHIRNPWINKLPARRTYPTP
jgi:hypothetical protein